METKIITICEESGWIAQQLLKMANSKPVPTYVLCIRTETQQMICKQMLRSVYEQGKDFDLFADTALKLAKAPIFFKDGQNMTLEQVVASIREYYRNTLCQQVYISDADYINPNLENDTNKNRTTLQTLRRLSKELGCKIHLHPRMLICTIRDKEYE